MNQIQKKILFSLIIIFGIFLFSPNFSKAYTPNISGYDCNCMPGGSTNYDVVGATCVEIGGDGAGTVYPACAQYSCNPGDMLNYDPLDCVSSDTTAPILSSFSLDGVAYVPGVTLGAWGDSYKDVPFGFISDESAQCGVEVKNSGTTIDTYAIGGYISDFSTGFKLHNLYPGSAYTVSITCYDHANNQTVVGMSFSVAANSSTAAPVISNVTFDESAYTQSMILPTGTTSVTISFDTNENAYCAYSPDSSFNPTFNLSVGQNTTSHSATIAPLYDGGSYNAYFRCADIDNNMSDVISLPYSVADSTPPVVGNPTINSTSWTAGMSIGTTPPNFSFTTNELATCEVHLTLPSGVTDYMNIWGESSAKTSHSMNIGGINSLGNYTIWLDCFDAANNYSHNSYTITIVSTGGGGGTCGTASRTFASSETGFGSYTLCATGTPTPTSPTFPAAGSSVQWDCVINTEGSSSPCIAVHSIDNSIASVPVASPAGGTYTNSQNVTLSSSTSGATIYYTLDGSSPSLSSTIYSAPILISSSKTLKAIAIKSGMLDSAVSLDNYIINNTQQVSSPSASPASGTYFSTQNVTLSTTTDGASIYYSLDGSLPSATSSTSFLYSNPIQLSASTALRAIAVKSGMTNSSVLDQSYTFLVAPPVATPGAGTYYSSPQTVTLSTLTAGALIYYTVDGAEPTTSSFLYSRPFLVSNNRTIKAVAYKLDGSYSSTTSAAYVFETGTVAPVVPSVVAGTYASAQTIILSTTTTGAKIYFTADNSDPTSSSTATEYTGPLTFSSTVALKAYASKAGMNNSPIFSGNYIIDLSNAVATPTSSLPGGTYTSNQNVTLSSATPGAAIYYTTDGTDPTTSSILYTGSISISATTALKAMAVKPAMTNSGIFTAQYTMAAAVPVASPTSGTFDDSLTLYLSSATEGASIYYSTNGSDPTAQSIKYDGSIYLTTNSVIKAIAIKSGLENSSIMSESYNIKSHNNGDGTGDGAAYFAKTEVKFSSKEVSDGITNQKKISLYFKNIEKADHYMISRKKNFSGASWKNKKSKIKLTLSSNGGKRSYYIKFKAADGSESRVFKKTVTYKTNVNPHINDSRDIVSRDSILVQSGSGFTKNGEIKLYFSKPNGSYYDPQTISANGDGNFSLSYKVKKPNGSYSWYAKDVATGKKSSLKYYQIK